MLKLMHGTMRLKARDFICATLALLLSSVSAVGQQVSVPVSKAQALRVVKVKAFADWHEWTTESGRFRVLGPCAPEIDDDVISVKGFRCVSGTDKWVANYMDVESTRVSDDAKRRAVYQESLAAVTSNGSVLLGQRDVVLHGRLGTESVIEGKGTVSYMRAFLVERRVYILGVSRNGSANGNPAIPADVQRFLDSFVYWD